MLLVSKKYFLEREKERTLEIKGLIGPTHLFYG